LNKRSLALLKKCLFLNKRSLALLKKCLLIQRSLALLKKVLVKTPKIAKKSEIAKISEKYSLKYMKIYFRWIFFRLAITEKYLQKTKYPK